MNQPGDLYFHIQQITGQILSGFTHELKNHLAIIDESSGLMEDYLSMGYAKSPEGEERLQNICEKVNERVMLASKMTQVLNSFAHRSDKQIHNVELKTFFEELLILVQRYAHLKNIELSIDPLSSSHAQETEPVLLGYIVHTLLFHIIQEKEGETTKQLTILIEKKDNVTAIVFSMNFSLRNNNKEIFSSGSNQNSTIEYAMTKLNMVYTVLSDREEQQTTIELKV